MKIVPNTKNLFLGRLVGFVFGWHAFFDLLALQFFVFLFLLFQFFLTFFVLVVCFCQWIILLVMFWVVVNQLYSNKR